MGVMKIATALFFSVILFSAFNATQTLTGKWIYAGGVFNGKKEGGPTNYTLQRNYDAIGFTALVIQKGYKTEKYEKGKYTIIADSCIETQTWCAQDSKLLNIPVYYQYTFRKDTLILSGTLPDGANVDEYWKRAKNL